MAKEIIMPKFGFTQEDSTIVAWLKNEGEKVEKGDPIAEVTTDKVNMEVEAPEDGILGGIRYQEGESVPVTEILAFILEEGEEAPEVAARPAARPETEAAPEAQAAPSQPPPAPAAEGETPTATPVARRVAEAEGVDLSAVSGSGVGGKITREDVEAYIAASGADGDGEKPRATPAARRAAREEGVDMAAVQGSGPRGRIQESDVLAAAASAPAQPALPAVPRPALVPSGEAVIIPLEGMRRTIAERLQASYQEAPHITFTLDVDMGKAIAFREYANQLISDDEPRISMTAVVVKAVAWALREHPTLNAYLTGDQIILLPDVNVGVAVALPDGLIVPVVHQADQKGLRQIGAEVVELTWRAREGRLRSNDVTDGTFTVSNLGMYGIDHFTAIINPPQVGILAVGRTTKRFVPDENDQPVARPIMTITLSVDHRVVDGAAAAQFATALRDALEEPASILL